MVRFQRSGRDNEALELCEPIKQTWPTEHAILSSLRLVYKGMGRFHDVTELYEHAVEQGQNSEEQLLNLYWCYNRESLYEKMQLLSMKLFTTCNKPE
jgi:hypothetical protein